MMNAPRIPAIAAPSILAALALMIPAAPVAAQAAGAPRPGTYVCYDLVLRTSLTFQRMEYRYELRDTFEILPGNRYRKEQKEGRYAYDPAARRLRFASGPYAGTGRVGEFMPAAETLDMPESARSRGRDNIILTSPGAPNRDNDWFCSVEG